MLQYHFCNITLQVAPTNWFKIKFLTIICFDINFATIIALKLILQQFLFQYKFCDSYYIVLILILKQ